MRVPVTTYRLQMHGGFPISAARRVLTYLSRLGVTDLYLSPILMARPASSHGYDVADPTKVNPELGSQQDLDRFAADLDRLDLGWMQDIVPNHMAFHPSNRYLAELFEQGPRSLYREFFDVDWNHPDPALRGRLLAPFLGSHLSDALDKRETTLCFDDQGFGIRYYDLRLPVCLESYADLLGQKTSSVEGRGGGRAPGNSHLARLVGRFDKPGRDLLKGKAQLIREVRASKNVRKAIDGILDRVNRRPAGKEADRLESLLERQTYCLDHYRQASRRLNYRRFFTINDLISIRVERSDVAEAVHRFVFEQARAGRITAFRIDHIDGLYDPAAYLDWIRRRTKGVFVVVEKILERDEALPKGWATQGTTGYDFLNLVNGLFSNRIKTAQIHCVYSRFVGRRRIPEALLIRGKKRVLDREMGGELENLVRDLDEARRAAGVGVNLHKNRLASALAEVMVGFPVYRTYFSRFSKSAQDRTVVRKAGEAARKARPDLRQEIDFLIRMLRLDFPSQASPSARKAWRHFVQRFQQVTGPVMAKGLEDTMLYQYGPLLSMNDVGGDPVSLGVSVGQWHRAQFQRARRWPFTMNATATHDTKRGEDARARLNVLSELSAEWSGELTAWSRLNRGFKVSIDGQEAPDRNDEYFLYQTLLASFPFQKSEMKSFRTRLADYLVKALREAKRHSDWDRPNRRYEAACLTFADSIIGRTGNKRFLDRFSSFARRIAFYGFLNSLSQLTLKTTAPGVPDFYQGSELWDFSFVDPDNRRPVDFDQRHKWLVQIESWRETEIPERVADLARNFADGRIKLFLTHRLLLARRDHGRLFLHGDYRGIPVVGTQKNRVIAYARTLGSRVGLTVATRFFADLVSEGRMPVGKTVWGGTRLAIPRRWQGFWRNRVTGRRLRLDGTADLALILADLPVALLIREKT